MATHSSTLAWKTPWEEFLRLQSMGSLSQTRLSDFTFTFHFHALEKEMATHSSVPAWRIPEMGEPGGLPSVGLHRVRHDWSDLAADLTVGVPAQRPSSNLLNRTQRRIARMSWKLGNSMAQWTTGQQTGHQSTGGLQMHWRKSLQFWEIWAGSTKMKPAGLSTLCSWQKHSAAEFHQPSWNKKGEREWEETTKFTMTHKMLTIY